MKTKNENPIDELFRTELSSYKVPLKVAGLSVGAAVIANKSGLLKFSIFNLNTFYSLVISISTLCGICFGGYLFFKDPSASHIAKTQISQQNSILQSQPNHTNTTIIDIVDSNELKISSNSNTEKPTSQSSISSTAKSIEPQKITVTQQKSEIQTKPIDAPAVKAVVGTTDSIQKVVAPVKVVRKVVVVKQSQVIVEDTVVQVVKRKRK